MSYVDQARMKILGKIELFRNDYYPDASRFEFDTESGELLLVYNNIWKSSVTKVFMYTVPRTRTYAAERCIARGGLLYGWVNCTDNDEVLYYFCTYKPLSKTAKIQYNKMLIKYQEATCKPIK